jgi:protein-S-isoprenylcysteine O-methyltransferase Ste14
MEVTMQTKKALLRSALVLYFVIAFEVLIMISPFAGFFYSVFNPVLLAFAQHAGTRWLSAFYLPHMVLPQDPFLQFLRVTGSVLFVLGLAVFLICAAQIYTAKVRKKGAVLGGLYSSIRHPQYLALAVAGLGLSILWPRFLTIVLWLVMVFVYYFLAKDEERRMLNAHEATYRASMMKTGMFLPSSVEKAIVPRSGTGRVLLGVALAGFVLGAAFLLRIYTVDQLTLWSKAPNASAVAILPEDGFKMDHRMGDILGLKEVKERMQDSKRYLIYFIPRDYIMQGMIADTGGTWKLFEQHHSLSMISDWVFHPFRHLREGHHAMHSGMQMQHHDDAGGNGVVRRLIFLSIEDVPVLKPSDLFAINALRVPQFYVDVEVHALKLLDVKDLPHGSGWGTVPTPVF